jgi:hypothetical protein
MRKSAQGLVFPLVSILSFLFLGVTKVKASDMLLLTPENAKDFGLSFQQVESAFYSAGIYLHEKEVGIRFHEESSKVDLTTFDGHSIVIDLKAASHDVNERIGPG